MPSVQVLIANQRIANRKGKIMKRRCQVCGKTFEGSNNSRYCSDQCRETPVYTDEFNGEQFGKLKIINAYRKKDAFTPYVNVTAEIYVRSATICYNLETTFPVVAKI